MGTAKTTAEDRNFYLKTVMAYRKVTTKRLSEMTGISQRTLERYTSGRTDIAEAGGLNVALISRVLSADAYILGGLSSVSMDALKKPAIDQQAGAASLTASARRQASTRRPQRRRFWKGSSRIISTGPQKIFLKLYIDSTAIKAVLFLHERIIIPVQKNNDPRFLS